MAMDSRIKNSFLVNLKVIPSAPGFSDLLAGYTKLPVALLSVSPYSTLVFESQDFKPLNIPEYTVMKDPMLKFIKVDGQQATIAPMVKDIGTHVFRLIAFTDTGVRYY
jgi:hypothetical protein